MPIVIGLFAAAALFYIPIVVVAAVKSMLNAYFWGLLARALLWFAGALFFVTTISMVFD